MKTKTQSKQKGSTQNGKAQVKKRQTRAELKRLISEDYMCTCHTYKEGSTDEKLFNDLFKVIQKNGLSPFITGETLKLVLGEVLMIKHKQ